MNKIKPIRSFVKRQRKLPPNKQKLFDDAWSIYGLDISAGKTPIKKILDDSGSLVLEIGFGMGTSFLHSAKKYPEKNFIGIEVHQPGIVTLFAELKIEPLKNIDVYYEDAVCVLQQCIPDHSLEKIMIFFPDPWQKKRHHKRRLIQSEFVELLQKKLKPKGILHIATDWENYAQHIVEVLSNSSGFTMLNPEESAAVVSDRTSTKFEKRGEKLGHKIFDLVFVCGN